MKRFMAVYTGSPAGMEKWNAKSEDERKRLQEQGMKAWMDWGKANASVIVEQGGPLGKTKRTTADGVSDIRNNLAGYTVVEAESHEAAARLFERHPHFAIFPGDGVEVMEILPVPGT